jgi:hypothetical protein
MTTAALQLHEYRPNQQKGGAWSYTGSIDGLRRLPDSANRDSFQGYLVPYRSGLEMNQLVIAGVNGSIHIDTGSGLVELLPTPIRVGLNPLWRPIELRTSKGYQTIHVSTPPWRYLLNDGMFPEDVEPAVHLLEKMTTETRHRFLAKFTTGKWPDEPRAA